MKRSKIICFAIGAMLAATTAWTDEVSIVSNILGPEEEFGKNKADRRKSNGRLEGT